MENRLRDDLKNLTAPLHKWLESSEILTKLDQELFEIKDYEELLIKLYVFINSVEILVEKHKTELENLGLDDVDLRICKKDLLTTDLALLGVTAKYERDIKFKSLDNVDSIVGALYVIEGSTMGGMKIKPLLEKILPQDSPIYFYSGYKEKTMPMWQKFSSWLDNSGVDRYKAILGANEAFIVLKKILDE